MKDSVVDWLEDAHRSEANLPKVMVIQSGARHGYQFPRMLENIGALERLHTTWVFDADASVLGRLVAPFVGHARARRRTGLGRARVHAHVGVDALRAGLRIVGSSQLTSRQRQNDWLGHRILRSYDGTPEVVLSIDGNGGAKTLEALKTRGAKILIDVAISPLAYDRMARAEAQHPKWHAGGRQRASGSAFRAHYNRLVQVADRVLYPSSTVLDGLRALPDFDESGARYLPYPTELPEHRTTRPTPGHVLFVGSDPVRKGLPDLALAMRYLRNAKGIYHLTVAGRLNDAALSRPEMSGVEVAGYLTKDKLAELRARSDVFVLPSWAEGLPAAGIEAMAAGLPVVATRSSGLPVEHGDNGFLVPEGDPSALADAISRIVSDRSLRADMSRNARKTAMRFRPDAVLHRLVDILSETDTTELAAE